MTIVGVSPTPEPNALAEPAATRGLPLVLAVGAFSKHLVLRTAGDPVALAPLVRRSCARSHPTAAVEHVTTMAEIRRTSVATRPLRCASWPASR